MGKKRRSKKTTGSQAFTLSGWKRKSFIIGIGIILLASVYVIYTGHGTRTLPILYPPKAPIRLAGFSVGRGKSGGAPHGVEQLLPPSEIPEIPTKDTALQGAPGHSYKEISSITRAEPSGKIPMEKERGIQSLSSSPASQVALRQKPKLFQTQEPQPSKPQNPAPYDSVSRIARHIIAQLPSSSKEVKVPPPKSPPLRKYGLQAVFSSKSMALKTLHLLKSHKAWSARWRASLQHRSTGKGNTNYRIILGSFPTLEAAQHFQKQGRLNSFTIVPL